MYKTRWILPIGLLSLFVLIRLAFCQPNLNQRYQLYSKSIQAGYSIRQTAATNAYKLKTSLATLAWGSPKFERIIPTSESTVDLASIELKVLPRSTGKSILTVNTKIRSEDLEVLPTGRSVNGNIIAGMPFGKTLLPSRAIRVGDSWTHSMPVKQSDPNRVQVHMEIKFKLTGIGKKKGKEILEIEMKGFRSFIRNDKTDALIERIVGPKKAPGLAYFFYKSQIFSLGTVYINNDDGIVERYEDHSNLTMLTLIPIPGMLRSYEMVRTY